MTDREKLEALKLEALKKVMEKLEDSMNLNNAEWIAWDKVLADIERIIRE